MDIEYLLVLQNARESMPGFIEQFFLAFSLVADGPGLVALTLIVYWCVNKRAGQFACLAFSAGNFVCQFLKNLVCIYRPWVRDVRVIPTADAIEGAGGYSFPSGHTNGAGTVFGSFAWLARKKYVWISVVCVVAFLIIAFSRNYLGVHTPQDVIVGLLIAVLAIFCTQKFLDWMDRCDVMTPGHNKDVITVVVVWVVSIASLIVLALKPYPLDYVDGVLLVDPETMLKGSWEAAGVIMGVSLGWLLERRYVGFTTDGLNLGERFARGGVGVVIAGVTYVVGGALFKAILPYNPAKLVSMFVLCVIAFYVVPLLFNWISGFFNKPGSNAVPASNDRNRARERASANVSDRRPERDLRLERDRVRQERGREFERNQMTRETSFEE